LDPSTQLGRIVSPLANTSQRFSIGTGASKARSPFAPRESSYRHKPSPLATADVISSNDSIEMRDVTSSMDSNETNIKAIMAFNNSSIQNSMISEQTISKMIEKNQLSVLSGNQSRPPVNFPNQDPVSRTIEANQLTIHSLHGFETRTTDQGIMTRHETSKLSSNNPNILYLQEGRGVLIGIAIIALFIIAPALRIFSGMHLFLKEIIIIMLLFRCLDFILCK
jgi:hypothetical protein